MVTVKSLAALPRGHERSRQIRHASGEIRHELAHGVIRPAAAVRDERAGVLTAYTLAVSVRGVGPSVARSVCARLFIPETKRLREMTDRQRDRLGKVLEVVGR